MTSGEYVRTGCSYHHCQTLLMLLSFTETYSCFTETTYSCTTSVLLDHESALQLFTYFISVHLFLQRCARKCKVMLYLVHLVDSAWYNLSSSYMLLLFRLNSLCTLGAHMHSDQREKRGGKPGEFTHVNDVRVDTR